MPDAPYHTILLPLLIAAQGGLPPLPLPLFLATPLYSWQA